MKADGVYRQQLQSRPFRGYRRRSHSPSRSHDQRNAVATSATVIPIKYETARSFPIFIALSPCGERPVYHSCIVKNLLFFCDTTV